VLTATAARACAVATPPAGTRRQSDRGDQCSRRRVTRAPPRRHRWRAQEQRCCPRPEIRAQHRRVL